MFTALALGLAIVTSWAASQANKTDRADYDRTQPDLLPITLHIRQELKLISFLLVGVIVMLGIVADRIR